MTKLKHSLLCAIICTAWISSVAAAINETASYSSVKRLVVIDYTVADKAVFYQNVEPGTEIVLMAEGQSGFAQLMKNASKYKHLEALYIVSHGEDGKFFLGEDVIDIEFVQQRRTELQQLSATLAPDADLLFYGCELAKSQKGERLLQSIAQSLNADVAASRNKTGSSALGGDWQLEYQYGSIESTIPNYDYAHVLATDTMNNASSSGNHVGSAVDSINYTIQGGTGWQVFDYGSDSAGHVDGMFASPSGATTSYTFTFSAPVDITRLALIEITPNRNNTYTFTDQTSGSSNNAIDFTSLTTSLSGTYGTGFETGTVDLNWSGVESFIITMSGSHSDSLLGFDNLVAVAASTDTTPPLVSSITLAGSPNATDSSVSFNVNFDDTAYNVSTDDFTVTTVLGTAAANVSAISASSGSAVTVTVGAISGAGTLRLDLNSNTNIIDADGNGNGTNGYVAAYTSGATHSVDKVAPTFDSPASLSSVSSSGAQLSVDLNEEGTAYYVVVNHGAMAPTAAQVKAGTDSTNATALASGQLTTSSTTGSVAISGLEDGTSYHVYVVAQDSVANLQTAPTQLNLTTADTPPNVSSITVSGSPAASASSVDFVVTFGDNISGVSSSDFSAKLDGNTVNGVSVSSVSITSGTSVTVTVSVTNAEGAVRLDLNSINNIVDESGTHPLAFTSGATHAADTIAPTVTSIVRKTPIAEKTNADSLVWTVTFSESVSNIGTLDFSVTGTTGTVSSVSSSSGNSVDVTVSGGDLASYNGNVGLSVANSNDLVDSGSNALSSTTPTGITESYTLDNDAPIFTSVVNSGDSYYKAGETISFTVTVSGAEVGLSLMADLSVLDTDFSSVATLTDNGNGTYSLTTPALDTGGNMQEGNIAVTFTATDAANNSTTHNTLTLNLDKTAPTFDGNNSTPTDNASNVIVGDNIVLDYSESVSLINGQTMILKDISNDTTRETFTATSATTATGDLGGSATVSSDKITLNPGSDLLAGTQYAVQIASTSVQDLAGNAFAGISDNTTFNFTTTPTLIINADTTAISEKAGSAIYTVALRDGSGNAFNATETVSVVIVLGGTATLNTDYSVSGLGSSNTVTITSGSSSVTFTVTAIEDAIDDGGETISATLNSVVSGSATIASSLPSSITISQNNPPVFSNLNATPSYTEDGSAVVLDSDVTINDTELSALNGGSGNYAGASLTITRSGGANNHDVFANSGLLGQLTEGGNLVYNGTVVGTVTTNSNGTLTLTFNSNATRTLVNSVMQNITYANSANEPPSSVVLNFTFNDGTEDSLGINQVTAAISPSNDSPTLAATPTNPTFTEGSDAIPVFTGSSVSTIESGQTLTGLVLTVSRLADGSSEILHVDGSTLSLENGLTGVSNRLTYTISVSSNTATITFTNGSFSEAEFQALINSIGYQNNSDDPTTTSSRLVTITSITDSGSNNATVSVSINSTVSLSPLNDEPRLTATAANPTFTENGDAVVLFSGASADTIERDQTLTGFTLTVTNIVDTGNEILNIDGTAITLHDAVSGTTTSNSLAYAVSVSSTVATVTLSGGNLTNTSLQALLNAISYQNNSDHPTVDNARVVTLTSLTDNGATTGNNDNVNDTLNISSTVSIAARNDIPVLSGFPPSFSVTEDLSSSLNLGSVRLSDAESNTVSVVLSVNSGTLTVSDGDGSHRGVTVSGSGTSSIMVTGSVADLNNWFAQTDVLRFTTVSNQTTNVTLTVTPSDADTGSVTASVLVVTSVNDAPIISGTPSISVAQDETYQFTPNASDVDGDSLTFSITNKPSWASFSSSTGALTGRPTNNDVGTTSGVVISVSDGNTSTSLSAFSLEVTNVNDAPTAVNDTFAFTVTDDGVYTLDVMSNDSDIDNDPLTLQWVTASSGKAYISSSNIVLNTNTIGTVNLKYGVSDGNNGTATGLVAVVISPNTAVAPEITAPNDVEVNATGLFTKVNLGVATAFDSTGKALPVSLVGQQTFFQPGKHTVHWITEDPAGNKATASQQVIVHPLVSISKDATTAEGSSHSVRVFLNGDAPEYPVTLPYTVNGTSDSADHNLTDGEVTISSGREGTIAFSVLQDSETEGDETLVITLSDTLNLGSKSSYTLRISEENVAPEVSINVTQSGESRSVVENSDETVTVTATVTDVNQNDSHTYQWINDNSSLANISSNNSVFEFDPSVLGSAIYKLQLVVTDSGSASTTVNIYIEVVEQLATLDSSDSDGDLIPDDQEGFGDSDNDGIPDYQDAISECNVVQQQALESSSYLVEGEPSVCLRKGVTLANNQTGGAQLLVTELAADDSADNVGGIFDFVAYGLPTAGQTYQIVLPQRLPVPRHAVYRKYSNGVWKTFTENASNFVSSAKGEQGYCPPPGDNAWTTGLTEGDWCVQLTIEDGGPNDDDGMANGSIVDPGGVATVASTTAPVAVADTVYVAINGSAVVKVLDNDTDADGDALSISSANAILGSVAISTNALIYTAPANFYGTDTITYSITDSNGGMATGSVTVNVTETAGGVIHNSAAGGGAGGIALFVLFALAMVRTHGRKLLIGILTLSSFHSQANWVLNADFGLSIAENDLSISDDSVRMINRRDHAWSAGLGYHINSDWSIAGRYVDLGEGSASLSSNSTMDPLEYHKSVAEVTPVLAKGFALDVSYALVREERASLNAVLGGFAWKADFDSQYQGSHINTTERGVDPYIGIGLDYHLTDQWYVGGQINRYFIDLNDVTTLSLKLSYQLGE